MLIMKEKSSSLASTYYKKKLLPRYK